MTPSCDRCTKKPQLPSARRLAVKFRVPTVCSKGHALSINKFSHTFLRVLGEDSGPCSDFDFDAPRITRFERILRDE